MNIEFAKYQATGNDFILIDNRTRKIHLAPKQIQRLCHRKLGIGADGLILIEPSEQADFFLNYYNSDGSQSLCGNGSRAGVHFAQQLGIIKNTTTFEAYDGPHKATFLPNNRIRIALHRVNSAERHPDGLFIHTGSPHFIKWVQQLEHFPVVPEGRAIRHDRRFEAQGGTNVNFAETLPGNTIAVRTYERGVEDETLSCGTGVTAAALAAAWQHGYTSPVHITTRGGSLEVEFSKQNESFDNIFLTGPAEQVFTGQINL
ncbi:MAG: diaminopimelate epimerase [Cyclobacteriaceae bacterium]|nr:MAG: diaminopimelate epimerase [Cyclobacteriaceae bacterium]